MNCGLVTGTGLFSILITMKRFKTHPTINGKEIDLDLLLQIVTSLGGWDKMEIRNQWEDLLEHFDLPRGTNGGHFIRQTYLEHFGTSEKASFLGQKVRNNEKVTPNSNGSGPQQNQAPPLPVPLPLPEYLRQRLGLFPKLVDTTDCDRLVLSLQSPLPNDQDVAISVCTILSNETKFALKLTKCPAILNLLLAHAGIYHHCGLRKLMEETYVLGRNMDVSKFWQDIVGSTSDVRQLLCESYVDRTQTSLGLLDEDSTVMEMEETTATESMEDENIIGCNSDEDEELFAPVSNASPTSPATKTLQINEESSACCSSCPCQKLEFDRIDSKKRTSNKRKKGQENCCGPEDSSLPFCLTRASGYDDKVGQRVSQIASIIRNLSFVEDNIGVMANNGTLLRYLLITANCSYGTLPQAAFDILGNIADQIKLNNPRKDPISSMLLKLVRSGLFSPDRFKVLRSLEILGGLTRIRRNECIIVKHFNLKNKVYNRMCDLLTICDLMMLVYTLECILAMTDLGEAVCDEFVRVHGSVVTLVSLLTVDARRYGPEGCINMKVVEKKPMAERSSSNQTSSTATVLVPPEGSSTLPKEILSEEGWAMAWIERAFEASTGRSIEQGEMYKLYCAARKSRTAVLPMDQFTQCVKNIFGPGVGPVVKSMSTVLKFIDGIRPKLAFKLSNTMTGTSVTNNVEISTSNGVVGSPSLKNVASAIPASTPKHPFPVQLPVAARIPFPSPFRAPNPKIPPGVSQGQQAKSQQQQANSSNSKVRSIAGKNSKAKSEKGKLDEIQTGSGVGESPSPSSTSIRSCIEPSDTKRSNEMLVDLLERKVMPSNSASGLPQRDIQITDKGLELIEKEKAEPDDAASLIQVALGGHDSQEPQRMTFYAGTPGLGLKRTFTLSSKGSLDQGPPAKKPTRYLQSAGSPVSGSPSVFQLPATNARFSATDNTLMRCNIRLAMNPQNPNQLTFARQVFYNPSGHPFTFDDGTGKRSGIPGHVIITRPGSLRLPTAQIGMPKPMNIPQSHPRQNHPESQSHRETLSGSQTASHSVPVIQAQDEIYPPRPFRITSRPEEEVSPREFDHFQNEQMDKELPYLCEWAGCGLRFSKHKQVFMHAVSAHCPESLQDAGCCEWGRNGCDQLRRKRFSMMTHLQDIHCSQDALELAAFRRKHKIEPYMPPIQPGFAPKDPKQALRYHALDPEEFAEKEGPVTKNIRLTSALILRNVCNYSALGKRILGGYEPHLATIAMNNVESSRTIAQLLHDMSEPN